MRVHSFLLLVSTVTAVVVTAVAASAQPLGSFSWQVQPYCNVLTLSVVQAGGVYTLDGFDDGCGAATRAAATGLATPNADGSIAFGLAIVTPSGAPVHLAARITLAALSGTWTDSAGASGTFAFAARAAGSPRPGARLAGSVLVPGSVGVAQVDTTQVQARVTGLCPAGQFAIRVNADGSLDCDPPLAMEGDGSGPYRTVGFNANLPVGATSPGTGQILESLTVTPPRNGSLLFRAVGTCTMTSLTTSSASIILGMFRPNETSFNITEVASLGVPAESPVGEHRIGFAVERLLPATAGTPISVAFRGYHAFGPAAPVLCYGRYSAQFFTGTLP